jgi:hypothetical protein
VFASIEPRQQCLELMLIENFSLFAHAHDTRFPRYILLGNRRFHMKLCQGKKRLPKSGAALKWLVSFVTYL